jgi:hypothetical protein|uniref:FAS1 domain-containing protein n=1 Tax=Fagus sylvatica TaxID=28930 RepID=A0A2N9HFA5_FAGSY
MAVKIVTLSLTLGVVILLLSLPDGVKPVHCIPSSELESMLSALRARGYNLFSNAIATSDLQFDLLCHSDNHISNAYHNDDYFFTFFAPTDSSLFALDMTQTAPYFTDTLRLHVVSRRLSFSQLRRLHLSSLPTLIPSRHLRLTTKPQIHDHRRLLVVSVNDVDVVFPGLYYGRYVAVHGLNGILNLRQHSSALHTVRPSHSCNRTAPPPQPQGYSPSLAPENQNPATPSPSIGKESSRRVSLMEMGNVDQDQLGEFLAVGWAA